MVKKLSLVFVGTGGLGVPTFEALLQDARFTIPYVVTGEDKPAGRKLILKPSVIKECALVNKIFIQQPGRIEELEGKLKADAPDFLLVVDYGQIIPKKILEAAKIAAINIHPSLLPKYRGPTPMHAPLLHGDKITGVSWILMSEKMDAGNIIAQKEFPVSEDDDYGSLSKKLSEFAGEQTANILAYFAESPTSHPQNDSQATYCKKIDKEDGHLFFQKESASEIIRKIKAYSIWPGTYTFWNETRLKILKAHEVEQKIDTGKVSVNEGKLYIGTKNNAVEIFELQPEGKRPMKAGEFLRGQQKLPNKID